MRSAFEMQMRLEAEEEGGPDSRLIAGVPEAPPGFLRSEATPELLKRFLARPVQARIRDLALGRQRLKLFMRHVRRWRTVTRESAPNTPFPILPLPALIRGYARDCIAFALFRDPQGCFGRAARLRLDEAVSRCPEAAMPPSLGRAGRRAFARVAVVRHVVGGRGTPFAACRMEKILRAPEAVVAEALEHTLQALSAGRVGASVGTDKEQINRLRRALRDKPGDHLSVEAAAEIEGWHAGLNGVQRSAHLRIGRKRLARLESLLERWGLRTGTPPNCPLAITPWPETLALYAKDAIGFVFQRATPEIFGQEAMRRLDGLILRLAADGLPAGLPVTESVALARFAIGRYLVGDPAPGAVLAGGARFDIFDPFASVEAALAVTDATYSMAEGLREFVRCDRRIFADWRRSQDQPAADDSKAKRPAGGALSAVWRLQSARCPLPTIPPILAWMYGEPARRPSREPLLQPDASASAPTLQDRRLIRPWRASEKTGLPKGKKALALGIG